MNVIRAIKRRLGIGVISFDFEPSVMKVLDRLQHRLHAPSRAEVLRRAIALINIACEAEKEGTHLFLKKGDKYQKVNL
jgi:hypothetical protein